MEEKYNPSIATSRHEYTENAVAPLRSIDLMSLEIIGTNREIQKKSKHVDAPIGKTIRAKNKTSSTDQAEPQADSVNLNIILETLRDCLFSTSGITSTTPPESCWVYRTSTNNN